MKEEKIKMSQKQLKRYEVIRKAIYGFITVSEASDVLGLSKRQIKRLKKKVKDFGAAALIHTGFNSDDDIKAMLTSLFLSKYT